MKIDTELIEIMFSHMDGRVKYELGAKAPRLDCDSSEIKKIDCSGFSRFVVARATKQRVILPDGSQNQLSWARNNLRPVNYRNVMHYCANDPSRWFVGFLSPKPGKEWPRHVWLGRSDGDKVMTVESCSSLGVGSRPWDTSILLACKECFEVTG